MLAIYKPGSERPSGFLNDDNQFERLSAEITKLFSGWCTKGVPTGMGGGSRKKGFWDGIEIIEANDETFVSLALSALLYEGYILEVE